MLPLLHLFLRLPATASDSNHRNATRHCFIPRPHLMLVISPHHNPVLRTCVQFAWISFKTCFSAPCPPQRLVRASREEAAAFEAGEAARRERLLSQASGFSEVCVCVCYSPHITCSSMCAYNMCFSEVRSCERKGWGLVSHLEPHFWLLFEPCVSERCTCVCVLCGARCVLAGREKTGCGLSLWVGRNSGFPFQVVKHQLGRAVEKGAWADRLTGRQSQPSLSSAPSVSGTPNRNRWSRAEAAYTDMSYHI